MLHLLCCACLLIYALGYGVPGAACHHAGKQAIQLPNTQLVAMSLNGLKVSI